MNITKNIFGILQMYYTGIIHIETLCETLIFLIYWKKKEKKTLFTKWKTIVF